MGWTVRELAFADHPLATVETPAEAIQLTLGLGSGLTRRAGDPPDRLWAVGDRGANIKIKPAVSRFGLTHLAAHADRKGTKVIPRPDLGPTIAELKRTETGIELVRMFALRTPDGTPLNGLPLPGAAEAAMEPALDLDGNVLTPSPAGADTEAIAALSDGSFWVAEEYGPSLMRVAPDGTLLARWTPKDSTVETSPEAERCLPGPAARRRLNRGFEAMAISPSERRLYLALQSAVEGEAHIRLWTLDANGGELIAEHRYAFDQPYSFLRDAAASGKVEYEDLKISEIACVDERRLLVLERVTESAKIYKVELGLDTFVEKTLLFSTDEAPQVAADLEGMAVVDDHTLVLVTDNDFGVEGAATRFYEVSFTSPFFGPFFG